MKIVIALETILILDQYEEVDNLNWSWDLLYGVFLTSGEVAK